METLRETYLRLINEILPRTYTEPVRANHCFARIVLDWLFQDCWFNYLARKTPAYKQLSSEQLYRAIGRMQNWIADHNLLVQDNIASLQYRGKRNVWVNKQHKNAVVLKNRID